MTAPATTRIALLRGINVGGHHKLPMAELRALFEAAGCTDVRTYIQSGNVLFSADDALASRIPASIGEAIRGRFGFDIPIVLRTSEELDTIVRACPYAVSPEQEKLLHVAFLADRPTADRVARLDPGRSPGDRFTVVGSEVYVHYGAGAARSTLNAAYLDRTLQTVSTARNWRTTCRLLTMSRGG